MVEERKNSFWTQVAGSGMAVDLVVLPCLGLLAYVLFLFRRHFSPLEGAVLVMVMGGLLRVGRRWWEWQRSLSEGGVLRDWQQRILQGGREPLHLPEGLPEDELRAATTLNLVLGELRNTQEELAWVRQSLNREWRDLDELLGTVERGQRVDQEARLRVAAQFATISRGLRVAVEDDFELDLMELDHRLRADQHRFQSQTFQASLGQVNGGLEQFENLLQELHDSFPRLRREEDALGRLADAGLRQGARLSLSVKGLVANAPKLVEENQARQEWLRRFRQSTDEVRDRTESLARRIEAFREESQQRNRTFNTAQGSMNGLDLVAQQTGLLAVNAAILAQQGGGSVGMAAIGGRLRSLADQTAEGASDLERALKQHQQELERESAGLWDLQEGSEKLLSGIHELLRMAGQLDQHSYDLEQSLESHIDLVDQVRQTAERAELSLHEVGERARALEAAHGRQWGVEAKIVPERERLSRAGQRLAEVGGELGRIGQINVDSASGILHRHKVIRKSEAYHQITAGGLSQLLAPSGERSALHRLAWARAQRRSRLASPIPDRLPVGWRDPSGLVRVRLLGQDALGLPEGSALESWTSDEAGQAWQFHLLPGLRSEWHRLALIEALKESPLRGCLPGLTIHIIAEGVELRLPTPYPGFPAFLAGLGIELQLEAEAQDQPFREVGARRPRVQQLIWVGPSRNGGLENPCFRLVHQWMRDNPEHDIFLPWLPYQGHRPFFPDQPLADTAEVETPMHVRTLGLGADVALVHPLRDRLYAAGASEGDDGIVLCAVGIGHDHPEALLLRLFQEDVGLAGAFHPDLVPYQARIREEVLNGITGDPYKAAWSILEDLRREGWILPLSSTLT